MSTGNERTGRVIVLDDRSRPDARTALGSLLSRSASADIAVNRLRLAAIDFRDRDLAGLRECRVILGHLDVHALIEAAESAASAPDGAANVAVLRRFIATGRLQLRSGGASRWRPDFCIVRGRDLDRRHRDRALSIVGNLGLGEPAARGPRLTCVVAGPPAVARVEAAFDRLWADGHDVLDVVAETLERFAGQ